MLGACACVRVRVCARAVVWLCSRGFVRARGRVCVCVCARARQARFTCDPNPSVPRSSCEVAPSHTNNYCTVRISIIIIDYYRLFLLSKMRISIIILCVLSYTVQEICSRRRPPILVRGLPYAHPLIAPLSSPPTPPSPPRRTHPPPNLPPHPLPLHPPLRPIPSPACRSPTPLPFT